MQKNTESVIRRAFILLIFCLFHFQTAYALDVNGLISDPTRWSRADSPVNITGNVRVAANAALTIDAGVTVIFKSSPDASQGYSIKIGGTLTAKGDPMNPILFTAADPTVPWGAITFEDSSADWDAAGAKGCVIEYCVIEFGGNDPDSGSMISAFNAMPLIANNVIRFGVSAGISAFVSGDPATISSLSGDIQITANRIHNNPTGLRLAAEGGVIENNYFLNNNRAMDVQTRSNDLTIKNNTVVSSAPELFGTGLRLILDERSNGITAYQWRQTAGTPVTLSDPKSARTAFIASDPGSKLEKLQFELTVTDEQGNQSTTKTRPINVYGDNPPPEAQAGGDRAVQLPQEAGDVLLITLSGAGSSDFFLGIAAYSWKQTAGKSVSLENADTINPSFIVPDTVSAGDRMTFELTVTDQGGLTATDSVSITYYDDNIFPVAAAGDDRGVTQGSTVFLNGRGSSDPDGSIISYSWTQTNEPKVALINPNSATPYFEAPTDNTTAETFEFRLRVTDNGGLEGVDDIAITVYGPLIAAIGPITPASGGIFILDGSASVDTSATAEIVIENNRLEMSNPDAGLFALSAQDNSAFTLAIAGNNFQATDNEGYLAYTYNWSKNAPQIIEMPENWWGSSDARVVETLIYDQAIDSQLPEIDFQPLADKAYPDAGTALPYPPIANAGPDQEMAADNLVTLDGSGSYDPDDIARYEWQQTDGTPVALRDSDQPAATFIAPAGGTDGAALQFTLTVATDDTFSHTDTVNVIVIADEPLPEVDVDACFIESARSGSANPGLTDKASAVGAAAALLLAAVVFFRRQRWRKLMPVIFLLMAAVFMPVTGAEAGYFAAGGGAGGDADEVNATIETGAKDIYFHNLDLLFGAGVFFIPHSDNDLPSPTIALPCPNNECVSLDSARKGTEVGFVGKLGIEIGSSDFYVSALGGFTAYTESELSRSTPTGRVYEESSDSKIEGVYGGGVSYFMNYKWNIVFQVDYDNIRGVTGTIGWHW